MQGLINISSFALLVGAIGLGWFYKRFPLHLPYWLILAILLLPWVTTFAISFCNAAPFGPRTYRRTLIGVMCWYLLLAVGAEIGQQTWQLPADGSITQVAARCLVWFGSLSFIAFALAIRNIRKIEKDYPPLNISNQRNFKNPNQSA